MRGGLCPSCKIQWGGLCPSCKIHGGDFDHVYKNEQGGFCPGGFCPTLEFLSPASADNLCKNAVSDLDPICLTF